MGSLWWDTYQSDMVIHFTKWLIGIYVCMHGPNDFTVSITINGMSEMVGFCFDKMHIPAYRDLSVQILQTECWNLWLWLILNKSVYGEMALRMGHFLICEWKKDSKSHADKRNLAMSICIISNSWKRFHTQSARYEIFGHWFSTWNSVWHFSSNYWLVDN